jgi:hypothetical protein
MFKLKRQSEPTFSLSAEMLQQVLEHVRPLGHHEDTENLNIGFGFLYYGLMRDVAPATCDGNRFGIRLQRCLFVARTT